LKEKVREEKHETIKDDAPRLLLSLAKESDESIVLTSWPWLSIGMDPRGPWAS
jgi:hypothetical protein